MIIVLEKFDIDSIVNSRRKNKHQDDLSVKEGWGNHRLFGSVKKLLEEMPLTY